MLTQRQYTAVSTIQVERQTAKVLDIESVENDQNVAPGSEFYQTQYALLQSRSLTEAVVRALNLSDNYQFLADFDAQDAESLRGLSRQERFKLATDKITESTAIAPVRGSSVIDIRVELAHPALAAKVANEYAEKFIEANLSRRFEASAYARQFLQNRLSTVRARLEESERRATAYARAQGLINIGSATTDGQRSEQPLIVSELDQLSSQLASARAARETAEANFRANSGGSAAERSLTIGAVNELRQERAKLTAELRKLESDFGPQYPKVLALKAQLNELNRQVAQEEGVVRSGVNRDLYDDYRQALATEQGIQRRVNQLKRGVLDQQQRAIQLNIIQRDVDTNRALYDALLQRFKEVGIAGGIGTNNVSIVDPAVPPESPSSPNLPFNILLGLVFGLTLGIGAAFMLEQWSEATILPGDFQQKLGIPLLGSTPRVRGEARKALFARRAETAGEPRKELVKSNSELEEAYFSILTSVQFSTAQGAPRTLSVTSSQAGEGKSTTALALAKALSTLGLRVLIVDCDLRNPSLHRTLNLDHGRGFSDVLTGKAELMDVVQTVGESGLSAIVAGPRPPNPAELLASAAFETALETGAAHFDHVVIDAPPVLGLADAPLIARATEGTVFVVEAGATRSGQARQALDRLLRVGAHMIGAVLTKLDSQNSGYGYGYGYNYTYGEA